MSINFGYGGYGAVNGMNQMANQGGAIYQSVASQYNCPMCYQNGAIPYNHKTYINPLPKETANPSFLTRILRKITGG